MEPGEYTLLVLSSLTPGQLGMETELGPQWRLDGEIARERSQDWTPGRVQPWGKEQVLEKRLQSMVQRGGGNVQGACSGAVQTVMHMVTANGHHEVQGTQGRNA